MSAKSMRVNQIKATQGNINAKRRLRQRQNNATLKPSKSNVSSKASNARHNKSRTDEEETNMKAQRKQMQTTKQSISIEL